MTTSHRSPIRRSLLAVLALVLLATACASDDPPLASGPTTDVVDGPDEDSTGTSGAVRRGRLQAFSACEEFLGHMRAEAAERVGPYGLDGVFGGGIGVVAEAAEEAMFDDSSADAVDTSSAGNSAPAQRTAAQSAPVEGEDFSGTNNQVLGVDEPDIVKTDGNRIITVIDNMVRVFAVNGTDATPQAELRLDTWPRELLLDGDRLLIMSDTWGGEGPGVAFDTTSEAYGPATVVTQVEINGDAMNVLGHLRLEGHYVSARKIGGVARLVVSAPPPQLSFIYPQGQGSEDIARETNQRIVQESTLEDWLSSYQVVTPAGDVTATGAIAPCERIYRPSDFSGFGLMTVLTVDMQGALTAGNGTAVVSDGQTVYASNDSLYIATNIWPTFPVEPFRAEVDVDDSEREEFEETYTTALHRFDITDPTTANYVASGDVAGSLLSQFSLDEFDGRLRVATTEGSPWGFSEQSESFITVLEAQGEDLVEVGRVGNMGRGERIFAVRFMGPTAYVVTFRQVDPLYVVDLRDPTAPAVTGELKIPGFSSYLHPVGDGLLLGVGQDATDQGRTLGAKVSLFDVSDPTNPLESRTRTWPSCRSTTGATSGRERSRCG